MKHLALALALLSTTACSKKSDAPAAGDKAAPGAAGDFADVDCDKMTTHTVGLLVAEATKGKSDAEVKQMTDAMAAKHGEMVKACEDEKGTKKLTHKQYDCLLAAPTAKDLAACVVPAN